MRRKLFLFLLIGLAIFLNGMQPAQATKIEFDLNYEYSAGTAPGGTRPWLTAIFDDDYNSLVGLAQGRVRLTMVAANLIGSEFISGWWFNFNDEKDQFASFLDYDPINSIAVGGDAGIAFSSGENFDKAGPDGEFDLLFNFPTANSENGWKRFTAGEQVIVDLFLEDDMGRPIDIFASDFDFESEPGKLAGDKGPFLSAAHIQSIGTSNGSGWIAPSSVLSPVPESSTLLLVGVGLIGLAGFGRRRFKA